MDRNIVDVRRHAMQYIIKTFPLPTIKQVQI